MRKIAFFDIDGTLTSETDGSVPESAANAIRAARKNGNLMFLNTGRCFQNVEPRFRAVGFDGYVCGCGTNIYCDGRELLSVTQPSDVIAKIVTAARETGVDLLTESRDAVAFDLSRPLSHPDARRQYQAFLDRGYAMPRDFFEPGFRMDKFVLWFLAPEQLAAFRQTSDLYFACIDRGGNFREFVPHGYSKSTGLQFVLDYYDIPLADSYAFGDSNNDLPMLSYVPNSIAMGNASPKSLKEQVSYVTENASAGGIAQALAHFGFL